MFVSYNSKPPEKKNNGKDSNFHVSSISSSFLSNQTWVKRKIKQNQNFKRTQITTHKKKKRTKKKGNKNTCCFVEWDLGSQWMMLKLQQVLVQQTLLCHWPRAQFLLPTPSDFASDLLLTNCSLTSVLLLVQVVCTK